MADPVWPSVYAELPLYPAQSQRPVRLLRLYPASGLDKAIKCKLFRGDSNDELEYEALSYVWGNEANPATISIQGNSHKVTQNLATALRYLRLRQDSMGRRIVHQPEGRRREITAGSTDAPCLHQQVHPPRGGLARRRGDGWNGSPLHNKLPRGGVGPSQGTGCRPEMVPRKGLAGGSYHHGTAVQAE
jgi:hypothetical protein